MSLSKTGWIGKNSIKSILLYAAVACAINVAVFIVMDALNFVHFSMNDDFYIQNLLNGSMGEYYTHFPHISVVLNYVLAGLYRLFGAVNWYGIYLFLGLLLACSFAGGVIMDKFGSRLGSALYILTVPFCFGMIVMNFTYTMVCYAMMGCALVCLIYAFYMENKKTRRFLYVISVIALVSSMALRKESAASALVYFGALGILFFIRYRRAATGFLLALIAGFAIFGGLTLIDGAYFASNKELADYKRFHAARINIMDHQPLDYARYPGLFADLGWSAQDVDYFWGSFTYPDDDRFSVEKMEYIYDGMADTRYNLNGQVVVQDAVNNVMDTGYLFMLVCLVAAFSAAFISQKKKLFRVFTAVIAALPFLFQILFNVLWRGEALRAWYPHYILSILLLIMLIDVASLRARAGGEINQKSVSAAAMLVFCVAGIGLCSSFFSTVQSRVSIDERLHARYGTSVEGIKEAYETMYAVSDELAFMYPTSNPLIEGNEAYSIFHAFPKDYFINNHLLGGWDTRSPAYNDFKKRYGLEVLPRDLAGSEVRLVSPDLARLQQFFADSYGLDVQYGDEIQLSPNIVAVRGVIANLPEN